MRGTLHAAFWAIGTATVLLVLVRALNGALRLRRGAKGTTPRAIVEAGQTIGALLATGAVVGGGVHGEDVASDAKWVGAFGAASALLLVVVGRASIATLAGGRVTKEIEDGNIAAAVAAGAHYVAIGVLLSHSVYGRGFASLGVAAVFFAAGVVTLHVLAAMFRALTAYDDAEEVLGRNLAAAVSYSGALIALAVIVGHAADGAFEGWTTSLGRFAVALSFALLLAPVRQIVVQSLLLGERPALRGGAIDQRVGREADVAAACVEAGAYLATGLMVTQL